MVHITLPVFVIFSTFCGGPIHFTCPLCVFLMYLSPSYTFSLSVLYLVSLCLLLVFLAIPPVSCELYPDLSLVQFLYLSLVFLGFTTACLCRLCCLTCHLSLHPSVLVCCACRENTTEISFPLREKVKQEESSTLWHFSHVGSICSASTFPCSTKKKKKETGN